MATVGKMIHDARLRLGLTQEELAARLSVTRQAVGNWEKDINLPKGRRAAKVAAALNIAPSSLDPFAFGSAIPIDASGELFTIPVIPLKDLAQIGEGVSDMIEVLQKLSIAALGVPSELKDCFCVQITDDSMTPDYRIGDEAIIDPGVDAIDGDDVLAVFAGKSALLRRFRDRGRDSAGGRVFDLVTPNADHVTVTVNSNQPGQLVGVVVEKRLKRRQRR